MIAACPGTPVLAQVGAPAQRDAVALAEHAAAAGAAAVMLITPYYNRVGPDELAGLARAVHGAAGGLPADRVHDARDGGLAVAARRAARARRPRAS